MFKKFMNEFYPFMVCCVLAVLQALMYDATLNPGHPDITIVWIAYLTYVVCFYSIYRLLRRV